MFNLNSTNTVLVGAIVILLVMQYNDKKDVTKFDEHSLSRMQYIESNLVSAEAKLEKILEANKESCHMYAVYGYRPNDGLCGIRQDIKNALIDVRPEIADLHKKLDK